MMVEKYALQRGAHALNIPFSSHVAQHSGYTAKARERMVQQLAAEGIGSPQVWQAMTSVERHGFVDSALLKQAYRDISLPIGLKQTVSKPSVVARMTALLLGAKCAQSANGLAPRLGRVLEIGTGCGYQAAILAHVADQVHSIERLRVLHNKARDNLRPLRLMNIHLILADGTAGCPSGTPYDGILCTASGTTLPSHWCEQLALGGRLVMPIAPYGRTQVLLVVDKTAQGFVQQVLEPVHFVPLKSGIA